MVQFGGLSEGLFGLWDLRIYLGRHSHVKWKWRPQDSFRPVKDDCLLKSKIGLY